MVFRSTLIFTMSLLAGSALAQNVQAPDGLFGTLFFNDASPMGTPSTIALDLAALQYRVATDGIDPNVRGETIAHIAFCSPLEIQLSVTDPDGFVLPVSECQERESFGPDLEAPALAPDAQKIAVTNFQLKEKSESGDLYASLLAETYVATQVYAMDGTIEEEYRDFGPATWLADGSLILAGRGGEAGHGIYRVAPGGGTPERIDDGRLNGVLDLIDAHPSENKIAFVFNGGIFEMETESGKPSRIHAHGALLSGLTYSPDGSMLAFVSRDTIDEALALGGSGYPAFIYADGEVEMIRMPFPIAGPMDWTE